MEKLVLAVRVSLAVALLPVGAACGAGDDDSAAAGVSTTAAGAATSTAPAQPATCPVPPSELAEGERAVAVYFYCEHAPLESDPVALPRRGGQGTAPLLDALEQLLAGPNAAEEAAGFYHSIFSAGTTGLLENVVVRSDGTAVVDFADQIRAVSNITTSNAGGQTDRSLAFTIFQFPSVKAVDYRIAGDRAAFCEFWETVCSEPYLTRARFESLRQNP